ncbi:glycoside hydrolase family 55 protein [Annulohypoxylon moriforme]|nr:glycoside hydrolase family 55 protein [Annulohypoxylon moriforme]
MIPLRLLSCLVALFSSLVVAQLYQDYIEQTIPDPNDPSGKSHIEAFFYQGTANDVPKQIVDLSTTNPVYLFYNCFYMHDICVNYVNFMKTSRGQMPHPRSGLPSYIFGYDLNTGTGRQTHSSQRRSKSCPDSWKDYHLCPESNQRPVMRHDGEWYTTELEPATERNTIRNDRRTGQIILSRVRYTCDEFPPATWIEGGNGIDGDQEAQTRCAAMRCLAGAKAEQDWQATAHNNLRRELKKAITQNKDEYKFFDTRNSVILFGFGIHNEPDGIAARIFTYVDSHMTDTERISQVKQGLKRSEGNDGQEAAGNLTVKPRAHHWPEQPPTYEQLKASVSVGHVSETIVHANDSFVPWDDLGGMAMQGMPGMDMKFRWDLDEDVLEEDDDWVEPQKKSVTKRQPVLNFRSISDPTITPLLKRASAQDLENARSIVEDAITKSSKLNAARLANPLRNSYGLKPGTVIGASGVTAQGLVGNTTSTVPPLLEITDEIAEAAALLAESDATEAAGNVTKRAVAASGTFWMEGLARKGTVPWGDDPDYKVFRNVLDYGAVGDGVTDDTKAIKLAMTDGKRCGVKCNGSTTKNAIVYFPPGTYLISTTIPMPFGTQVIGDANNRPTLKASKNFIGLGVLSTDEYTGASGPGPDGNDQEYYINTANFYRQIRNVIIDVTLTRDAQKVSCLHYQVAQATSLQNVELVAAAGSSQTGMYAENGSGGQISDVVFRGGAAGIYGGNQQFTAQRLTFDGCTTGVQVIWDWGWIWKSVTMSNVDVGFKLTSDDGSGNIGSVSIIDSSFSNVGTAAVVISPPSSETASGSTGVVLENVALSGVAATVQDTTGKTILDASAPVIAQWALGPTYGGDVDSRKFSSGERVGNYRRQSTLVDSDGTYFERARPQYESLTVDDFVHIKDLGATGDGSTDDTAAFQAALYASQGKILFIDAGSYILTSTVIIPQGTKIVGETWSQLVAAGSYFEDASNPRVFLKVGNEGDKGNIEMQDLIFTNRGPTAGLILVEWNIEAESPGSAGLWDCHARIGGATGTELTPAECPPVTSGVDQGCSAASLMFHLTSSGSGYFENMWLWGSDHMIDDPNLNDANNTMEQNSIYIARGFLIESTKATWLYATASEHAVFYQYNFHKASNIFAGMLQTESPYFQPTPPPPAPFEAVLDLFPGDPDYTCDANDDFSGCDESWGVIIRESTNIFIAGAGIYSWFSTYSQDCIDVHKCQKALILLDSNNANVRFQNLITIGAEYMAVMDGKGIKALDNLNMDKHPSWSQISILDVASNTTQFDNLVWIDPAIWEDDQPQFTCLPPCTVKIPPWTGATSTVNYPLLTVSDGTWTSTITKPPITVSQWIFEVVTLKQDADAQNNKVKRQNFDAFWPVPASTPSWPAVIYNGPDGLPTTTAPTGTFPTPPPSIGPDAPPPPTGSWPQRAIQPYPGLNDQPSVIECEYFDFGCIGEPWIYGDNGTDTGSGGDDDDFDENWEDLKTVCEIPTSSSSTTTSTTTKVDPPTPEPSPFEHGDPTKNQLSCYNNGENTEHVRMDSAANSFCNAVLKPGGVAPQNIVVSKSYPFDWNGGIGTVSISIQLEVKPKCEWLYSYNECRKYLSVPVDSCNCDGENGKQGGVVENNCLKWTIDPNIAS